MQFHAIKPAHSGTTAFGKAGKGFVAVDPAIMTDRQMGTIRNIDACSFTRQVMQQHAQWHEQAGLKGDEPAIAWKIGKQVPVMGANAIKIEQFEASEAACMKEDHDEQHLGQG